MTRRALLAILPALSSVPDGCWIALTEGRRKWVWGHRFGHFLVHRTPLTDGSYGWQCTHIPTGHNTGQWLYYRESAVEIAQALGPVMDWSQVRGRADISPEIDERCRAIIRAIQRRDTDRHWDEEVQP